MKTVDNNIELQNLLAEIKQLEQDLLETAQKGFPNYDNDDYFKEIFAEIDLNKAAINDLIEQNRQAEQEYLLAKQEEQELEIVKKQLQYQMAEQKQMSSWKDKK